DPALLDVLELADVAVAHRLVDRDPLVVDEDPQHVDLALAGEALAHDVLGRTEALAGVRPVDARVLVQLSGDRRVVAARDPAPQPVRRVQEVTSAGHPAPPLTPMAFIRRPLTAR